MTLDYIPFILSSDETTFWVEEGDEQPLRDIWFNSVDEAMSAAAGAAAVGFNFQLTTYWEAAENDTYTEKARLTIMETIVGASGPEPSAAAWKSA